MVKAAYSRSAVSQGTNRGAIPKENNPSTGAVICPTYESVPPRLAQLNVGLKYLY